MTILILQKIIKRRAKLFRILPGSKIVLNFGTIFLKIINLGQNPKIKDHKQPWKGCLWQKFIQNSGQIEKHQKHIGGKNGKNKKIWTKLG